MGFVRDCELARLQVERQVPMTAAALVATRFTQNKSFESNNMFFLPPQIQASLRKLHT